MKLFFLSAYLPFFLLLVLAKGIAQPPMNDDCSGSVLVTPVSFSTNCLSSVHGTTANATQSLPNPTCTSVENNDDIWYQFQAQTASLIIRFSNVINDGTGSRGTLGAALYEGDCPATGESIYCNNILANGSGYKIINGLTIGTIYYLRIWSTLTGVNSISFDFCVQSIQPSQNDECSGAIEIITQPAGTNCSSGNSATTVGATPGSTNICENNFNDDDIWYRFTAGTGAARINFSNARNATRAGNGALGFAIYQGGCTKPGSPLQCKDNIGTGSGTELIGGLIAGQEYYIQFYSYATNDFITFDFCITDSDLPGNDECANAIDVPVSNTGFCENAISGNLNNSTPSPGMNAPVCVVLSGSEDIWFKTIVPASGSLVVQTSAVNTEIIDLVLEAYEGSCGSLTLIACDDDGNSDPSPSAWHSRLSFQGRPVGETIYLRVLGKGSINWGAFNICAWDSSVQPPVSNGGNCISAQNITINTTQQNQYRWVPVLDNEGNIVAEVFGNGHDLNEITSSVFVNSSGTVRDNNAQYYLDRNLTINASGNGTARVRFYFTHNEWEALQLAQPTLTSINELKINKVSENCMSVFPGNATVISQDGWGNYGEDFYVEFTTPSFSSFYIDALSGALPLKFISFNVKATIAGSELQWQVVADNDIAGFEVEYSDNGQSFSTIATIMADAFENESSGARMYEYKDAVIRDGIHFYRILMKGLDGEWKYTHTFKINDNLSLSTPVRLYPNPVNTMLSVELSLQTPGVMLQLYNLNGAVVRKETSMPGFKQGIIQLDMNGLTPGIYLLQVRHTKSGETFLRKIVKQ